MVKLHLIGSSKGQKYKNAFFLEILTIKNLQY